jgi:hypothetical protein
MRSALSRKFVTRSSVKKKSGLTMKPDFFFLQSDFGDDGLAEILVNTDLAQRARDTSGAVHIPTGRRPFLPHVQGTTSVS